MKRFVSVAIVLCMAVAIISAAIPVSAAQSSITTNKEVYEVGEPIMVSATSANGDEHDWVGILPKGAERWGSLAWIYLKDINGRARFTVDYDEDEDGDLDGDMTVFDLQFVRVAVEFDFKSILFVPADDSEAVTV